MKVIARSIIALVGSLAMVLGVSISAHADTGGSAAGRLLSNVARPQMNVLETHEDIVSAVPASWTPQVLDGAVLEIAQVGNTIVVGGSFDQISQTSNSAAINQSRVFAFNATNGAIISSFDPVVTNGDVFSVKPGPVAGTVYVAGSFSSINGVNRRVALLDVATGDIVAGWNPPAINGAVRDVILDGDRLYLGGTFSKVGGVDHLGLATLSPTTGARQTFLDVALTENHNWTPGSSSSKGAIGVKSLALSPDGDTLVAIGNFRKADGLDRRQVVMIDTSGSTAEVKTDWKTDGYVPACFYWAFDSYVRDVSFAPDGSYFSIATTGGHNSNTLCDTIATFDTEATGTNVRPIWVDDAGGDTFLSVASSGSVVYAGGHQRWMNNPLGNDTPSYGAVPRPGLGGMSPDNGLPIDWNPGRHPRGYGAEALTVTEDGLWVGSDTPWIGNYQYKRQRLAYFPLAGGSEYMNTDGQSLPTNIYTVSSGSSTLNRFYFDGSGSSTPVTPGPTSTIPWSSVRAATLIGDTLFYVSTSGNTLSRATFDGTSVGTPAVLDPYNDPVWSDVRVAGNTTRTFRGLPTRFNSSDIPSMQGMFYDNGRLYYTKTGSSSITSRAFQPDTGILTEATSTVPGFSQTSIGSVFLDAESGYLYFTNTSTGTLSRIAWVSGTGSTPGTTSGSATVVSGPAVDGRSWTNQRVFPGPGPMPNQAPSADFEFDCVGRDCSFDGSGSTDSDGSIASYTWDFGDGESGTGIEIDHSFEVGGDYTVELTVTDDGGLSDSRSESIDVAPSVAPTASFSVSCDQLACTVDGSESTDADGDALTYAWQFGDGGTATGVTAQHDFTSAGTYTVSLTVTDSTEQSDTATEDITVSEASAPELVGTSTAGRNAAFARVTLPSGIESGDLLVVVAALASPGDPGAPTGAGSWTVTDDVVSGNLRIVTWSKVADGTESGATVNVTLSSTYKSQVTALVYRGASGISAAHDSFASSSEHLSPTTSVPSLPATAVTIWADRWSSALTWTAPAGVNVLVNEVGTGGGRVSQLVVQQTVSGASYGGLIATTSAATQRSAAVTLILSS